MQVSLDWEGNYGLRCVERSVRKITGTRNLGRFFAMGIFGLDGQNENGLFWFCVAFP